MSQTAHKFDPNILREYDIRGVVGKEVHAADAGSFAHALVGRGRPVLLSPNRHAEPSKASGSTDESSSSVSMTTATSESGRKNAAR